MGGGPCDDVDALEGFYSQGWTGAYGAPSAQVGFDNNFEAQDEATYDANVNAAFHTPPEGAWVAAGGDYQGTGCLRNVGGDTVWCPPPMASTGSPGSIIGQNPWGPAMQALKQAAQNAGNAGRIGPRVSPPPQHHPGK